MELENILYLLIVRQIIYFTLKIQFKKVRDIFEVHRLYFNNLICSSISHVEPMPSFMLCLAFDEQLAEYANSARTTSRWHSNTTTSILLKAFCSLVCSYVQPAFPFTRTVNESASFSSNSHN